MPSDYRKFFDCDPRICGGALGIKGRRIPIRVILSCLAEGDTPHALLENFPTMSEEALHAVIAYAADKKVRTWEPSSLGISPQP